jgi:chorismate synthase
MSANTFGSLFTLTSFGESHGTALGAVIDGCPAGVKWDDQVLQREIARRRPGQITASGSNVVTDRNESDSVEILSGVFQGLTLGTPIAVIVRNNDARSQDYDKVAVSPRAGHADDVWKMKFGHSDHRGGGRSSGRETVARVIGGAVAQMFLKQATPKLSIKGFASQIGPFSLSETDRSQISSVRVEDYVARFPSSQQKEVEKLLLDAKQQGKSYGGTAEIWLDGVPQGLGQPVFRKLKSDLAAAMMSVGATSGVEIGEGFDSTEAEGSEFHRRDESPYGGIRGGISTGERIVVRVAFKPTSSVLDVAKQGRHDPCIVTRAIPVLEAMALLVIADHVLLARADRV